MNPTAFPLAWPQGKPRTSPGKRSDGRFTMSSSGTFSTIEVGSKPGRSAITIAKALERLDGELGRMGARSPVVSTNVELNRNGTPRSTRTVVTDPGVAVYFQLSDKPVTLACDRYSTVGANLAAIAAHVAAMRTAERHGVGSLAEMFAGFRSLPSAESDWRRLLGSPATLQQAEAVYRELVRKHHPDVTGAGNDDQMAAWNVAIAQAREYFANT